MKNYLLSVASSPLDQTLNYLENDEWVAKFANSGSYYHETDSTDVVRSFYDKWLLNNLKDHEYCYEVTTNSIVSVEANYRIKVTDYEEVPNYLAEILRQCD